MLPRGAGRQHGSVCLGQVGGAAAQRRQMRVGCTDTGVTQRWTRARHSWRPSDGATSGAGPSRDDAEWWAATGEADKNTALGDEIS